MSDLIKTENKISLSNDINVITAEILFFKNVGEQAVIEIGKRFKHVRDNLKKERGEYTKWCENDVGMNINTVNRFIQVYEKYGNYTMSYSLGSGKLFELLSLPESINKEDFIQQSHIIPSTGEQKTVDDMTVKELREVKKALKEAQDKTKQLELELEQEKNKEPIIQEKEVISEDIKIKLKKLEEDLKKKNTELQNANITKQAKEKLEKEILQLKNDKKKVEDDKLELEKQLNSEDFELEKLRKEREKLETKTHINIFELQLITEDYLKKASPFLFLQGIKVIDAPIIKEDFLDTIEALENFTFKLREMIEGKNKIINIRDYTSEIIINKEENVNGKLTRC